jgi:hypothetical protein
MLKNSSILILLVFTLNSCFLDTTLYQTNDREYEISATIQNMNKQKLMNETADWILRNFTTRDRLMLNYDSGYLNSISVSNSNEIIQSFDLERGRITAVGVSTFSSRTDFECRIEVEIIDNKITMIFNQFIHFNFGYPEFAKNHYTIRNIKNDIGRISYPYLKSQIEKYKTNNIFE